MKDIPGYEGRYAITEHGGVWTHPKRGMKGKFMKTRVNNMGYGTVHLTMNGKSTGKLLHRLLALTYIPNPDNKPDINHKNGKKLDNRVENLEWCTRSENSLHYHRELKAKKIYKRIKNSDKTPYVVKEFTLSLLGSSLDCYEVGRNKKIDKVLTYDL